MQKLGLLLCPHHLMYAMGGSGASGVCGGAESHFCPVFDTWQRWSSNAHRSVHLYLDNKGRLTMPSRFRDDLPEQLIVTKGFDQCVAVYPIQVRRELTAKISALPLTDPKGRELRRCWLSEAMDSGAR